MQRPSGPEVEQAIAIFGEPNWRLSSADEIRFGNNGSISYSVPKNLWYSHETGDGGRLDEIQAKAEALWPKMIVAKYDYKDVLGNVAYQVVRYMPKDFRQRIPDRNFEGRWIWKGPDEQLPYRLPELVSSFEDEIVFLVEGEKDADALAALGYVATTKSGGSGGWKPELTKWFKGKNVFVVPDNDEAGRKTARNSASALAGIAGSVKVADICEGMAPRSDISDWLAVHNTAELEELLQKAPAFSTEEIVNITDLFFTIDAGDMDAVISADDFVEDLLIAGQMSVVYGPSGSGKTFFASDLALHVAHGRAWRGREVTQGGVLYIAAEGAYGIRNRIVAFQKRFGGDPPPLAVLPSNVNFFDSEEDISRLLSTIEAKAEEFGGVSLVVVDTLARVLAGGNENSSEDMGALIRNSDRVRQTAGAHVMLIHHTGKDEARGARGHSSLRAATDTEIEISMSDLGATARVTKQRELEMSGEFGFELDTVELGIGPRGKPITSCVVRAIEFTAPKKMRRPRYPNQKVIWKVVRKMKKDKALFPLPLPLQGYGIMMDDLFEKCRSQFLCDERHRRERFEKALEGLIGDDFVDHNEGWIWLK